MTIILILRWMIFGTFILLLAEGIIALFVSRWFYKLYVRKHLALEARIGAIERQIGLSEQERHELD